MGGGGGGGGGGGRQIVWFNKSSLAFKMLFISMAPRP